MKLIRDLKEFIELLNSENVRYLVIGGWAFNRYAEARFTGDIDFFLDDSEENQRCIRSVLEKFGFGDEIAGSSNLFEKPIVILGRPPNRIDLITRIDGVEFKQAWSNREQDELDGVPVQFISFEDLVANKRAAGRPKDLSDLAVLRSMKPEK